VSPTFVGAGKLQGLTVFRPEGATGTPSTNYSRKLEAAVRALEGSDVVFLHVDAAAEASHSRDFVAKVQALERLDGAVVAPRSARPSGAATCACCRRRRGGRLRLRPPLHDPVPFAMFGAGVRGHRGDAFTEVAAREGGFLVERAHELLEFVLH